MQLPDTFLNRIQEITGNDTDALLASLTASAPVSVRVNNKVPDYEPSGERVPWCEQGYYLDKRPLFTADPWFHGGVYYVQEASSMFLKQALQQHFSDAKTVLDLCAAPGGKSTLLRQFLPESSLLVSNEIIRSRAHILAENLVKWGNTHFVVTNNKPSDIGQLTNFFDAIVVDAPCSGEGMFRKDPEAINEWSVQNVITCSERQETILTDVWDSLKTGGILVYSTCTYNREENEEKVAWILSELGAEYLPLQIDGFEGITETPFGYRFFPHKTKGEGFFMAVMRKTSDSGHPIKIKGELSKGQKKIKPESTIIHLKNPDDFVWMQDENIIQIYPKDWFETLIFLGKKLNCLENGLQIAEIKGKDQIPAYQIALSKAIDTEKTRYIDLNYEQSISFLKKENIILSDERNGYILVGYKGVALGWVKNLGNRCNNLYPAHWKIRMNL